MAKVIRKDSISSSTTGGMLVQDNHVEIIFDEAETDSIGELTITEYGVSVFSGTYKQLVEKLKTS